MPENILVVEYEPRYTDRVKAALAGQPMEASFAHDGEEALRILDSLHPRLIVLASPVPKGNAVDLIHAIRQRPHLQQVPILLAMSGYIGSTPKQDALKMGASDILPKPYSEGDFLHKVQEMLGSAEGHLTSKEIFGDILDDNAARGTRKPAASRNDVDKLVADTLSGVMQQKKSTASTPKPKTQPGQSEIDRRLADLTVTSRPKTAAGTTAVPKPAQPAASAAVVTPPPVTQRPEKVHASEPVFTPAVPAPAVPEEEPTDGVKFGQYVLLEKIASGGMAEVWKARMRGVEGFQKIVAIKKILPHLSDNQDFIEMFIDEAKLAAQLNHNNIIHIYDLGKIQNSYYIAMEFIDGHDLKTILKRAQERDQPLSIELSLFIASKIAAALDYAHRKRDFENRDLGLVHRDVSPQNVLISNEGDIKLCDFGIAKAASKASHTQAGALKGKLQYMSPEQAWGRTIDRRSDIFALATVLFEMLTSRKLFTGENEISILEQVREARVEPPSKYNEEITPEIDRIVLKALEKEPGARYQNAAELARDLDNVLYEFKPTPTSADLAIYMHRLETAPVVAAAPPEPEEVIDSQAATVPEAPPAAPATVTPPAPAGIVMPAWDARTSAPKKKAPVVPIAIAAVIVLAVVGGFFYIRSKSSEATATQSASKATPPVVAPSTTQAPAPAAASATVATTPTETLAPAPLTASTAEPAIDPSKVEEEVKKRLAAEKARLEQQARAQQAQSAAMTQRPPRMQPPLQSEPQPAPVVENRPPAPVPQPIVPQPVVQQPAPAPVPAPQPAPAAAPEPARAREGELVQSGSEDVVAKMLRRGVVPYPPLARVQRVEGTVIVSALISESGQVLQTKVIRPIPKAVGLNEAAEQIVRRSTFSPPMKDGVRVKAWTTIPVDFKL